MSPAYAYVRVSTEEQAKSGLSLDAQRARCIAYCALQGLELIETFDDPGVSAGKPLATRPGGMKLLAALADRKQAKRVCLVVTRLDRLFRDTVDCLVSHKQWAKRKVFLHLADEGGNCIDTSTAVGEMFLTTRAMMATFERSITRERIRVALAELGKQGKRRGKVPYGYECVDGTLIENEVETGVLSMIHLSSKSGKSCEQIAEELNINGIQTKERKGNWRPQTVRRIVARLAVQG